MTTGWEDEMFASFRASVDELSALLVAEEPLETLLSRVVGLACGGIGSCDLASVTLMGESAPETIVSTDPIANQIDDVQYSNDSGPCLHAFRHREIVSVPSMAQDDRWTAFREAALGCGVHSSFSLPLAAGEMRLGALNLYSRADHGFSSVPTDIALSFAQQAAATVWNARMRAQTREVIRNLELALESRDVIGTAKGIIMANEKVTADEAFAIMREVSQHRNVKLRDVAVDITATGETPDSVRGRRR